MVVVGVAYVTIGVATAALSRTVGSATAASGWRLSAWGLSAAVFLCHAVLARPRAGSGIVSAATQVALAAGIGALLLAVVGPVRSHWAEPNRARLVLLSVIAWPLLTGLPAFAAALGAEYFIVRMTTRTPS
jgi:hypothetical protein